MVRDPYVRSSLKILHNPLLAAIWDFKPVSEDPIDQKVVAFCRWNFFERLNWQEILRKVLYYHRDGVSLFEFTSEMAPTPARFGIAGGVGAIYTGVHYRPAWSVQKWHPKPSCPEELESVEQYLLGGDAAEGKLGYVRISADNLLRFTYEQEASQFTGLSLLRSAFGAWKTKRVFQILQGILFERHGVGMPVLTLPEDLGEAEISSAEEMLASLRAHEKGYLVLPTGYSFTWNTAQGQQSLAQALADAIAGCNRDITTNVLTGWMQLGSATNSGGSYALAEAQSIPAQTNADVEAKFICDRFYYGSDGWSPIKRLVALNFGPNVEAPRLVARNLPTRDWSKTLQILPSLVEKGVIRMDQPLRDFAREVMLLPPEDIASLEMAPPPAEKPYETPEKEVSE
jgi:hypothetical protein